MMLKVDDRVEIVDVSQNKKASYYQGILRTLGQNGTIKEIADGQCLVYMEDTNVRWWFYFCQVRSVPRATTLVDKNLRENKVMAEQLTTKAVLDIKVKSIVAILPRTKAIEVNGSNLRETSCLRYEKDSTALAKYVVIHIIPDTNIAVIEEIAKPNIFMVGLEYLEDATPEAKFKVDDFIIFDNKYCRIVEVEWRGKDYFYKVTARSKNANTNGSHVSVIECHLRGLD